MNLLLSEDLPLRTSADLGDYSEDAVLPVVYGDLSQSAVPVIKLSAIEYLAADHPATITAVYVDGQETKGWAGSTGTDASGHAYCQLTLAAPPESGAEITVAMQGKRHPITGALLEHPADILQDLLSLAGKTWDLSRLKTELPGLALAGRLDKAQSVRAWLDEITRSCGVVWAERFAASYPPLLTMVDGLGGGVSVTSLDAKSATVSSLTADIQDAADRLQIAFDYHHGKSAFAQYIEFSARPSPFGEAGNAPISKLEAPWLRQPSDALALGQRLLARLASNRISLAIETGKTLNVGDWFAITHPSLPLPPGTSWGGGNSAQMMALSIETQPGKPGRKLTGEITWGDAPLITLDKHARAIAPKAQGGVDVAYKNGIAAFTILGQDGKPLQNARVSLDGSAPKKTNAKGQVSFEAKPGAHLLAVEADGFTPFEMEVTL
ncbi:MAG: carboxypeptidase-like regulatory domain-containing protein [Sulfuricellaceae bacterium]|nr:carboxypeptidase-like regulatory domain-containing protein [Sulfuricellaceae bacterium]